jgi:hypothetical protein
MLVRGVQEVTGTSDNHLVFPSDTTSQILPQTTSIKVMLGRTQSLLPGSLGLPE